jgi:Fic family protein
VHLEPAPEYTELVAKLGGERLPEAIRVAMAARELDEYPHWDKLRRRKPPGGSSVEEWWLGVKALRAADRRPIPLQDANGAGFAYNLPDLVLRHLHRIDQRCGGEVAMDEVVTSERQAGQRFLVNSLMEEAIRSSQLEGAATSRKIAKEMLRTGRDPKDRSERMIFNNYRALQFMRDEMGDVLTPAAIMELHRIVTEGTLDDPSAAGRMQRPDETRVAVFDRDDGEPLHRPPPAEQLPERIELLCDFANQRTDQERFVHPVVRAILLHFWLAYDHPFEDGNGRTSRILFFWLLRREGYWLVEYLPISKFIRRAPAQYARAFLETETDGRDTTYFLIHQLKVIELAIDDLHVYLRRKISEVQEVEVLLRGAEGLNHRQLALLSDAIREPHAAYSLKSHSTSHRVTHETARVDLNDLVERGLLTRRRRGRQFWFEPDRDLPRRLQGVTAEPPR